MNKKGLAILLALAVVVSIFSACSKKPINEHELVTQTTTRITTDTSSFKLSYSQSDSLNPFEAETLNNQIVGELVFDSLFTLDESFEAQPNIATSYAYTDSTTLSVTIPSGIKFSDGTELTAQNVVNSFDYAKSSPHWGNSLKAIGSAYAQSNTVIIFKLNYANPNAHNLLTFAITKGETDEQGYSIGSGRYKFGASNGQIYVEVNKNHPNFTPHLTKIVLVNITANDSIENAVNIGNISYTFRDLSSGAKTKIKSNRKAVNLNSLVYLGVNNYSGCTANPYIRKAISLAIDRETLCKSAYQGYAKNALSVFNPSSKLGKQTQIFSSTADISAAKQAIAQSGIDEDNLNITILVGKNSCKYSIATLVKQQLEAVGFKVEIEKRSNDVYKNKVEYLGYNLYVAETKVSSDMNLNTFFNEGGTTHYGIDFEKCDTAKAYKGYLKGDNELGKFVLEFSEEMPFIPLLYRQGMICYSKSMHGDMQGYAGNYFSNIEDWYFN